MANENFAIVANGVIENVVVIDSADAVTIAALGGVQIPSGTPVAIGWGYDGTNFIDPAYATLAEAQTSQNALLHQSYLDAIAQPVSYTSTGGITQTYQADQWSQGVLNKELDVYTPLGATPAGYYWVAQDNTQVPFTLADLQGLAQAIGAQGWAAFQNLQTKKAAVLAATTVADVQAVVW